MRYLGQIIEDASDFSWLLTLIDKGTAVLIAFIAFAGTSAGSKQLARWADRKKKQRAQDAVYRENINHQKVYRLLRDVIDIGTIDRLLIFKGHNNGTAGKPLDTYHVRCVQAACRDISRESYYLKQYEHFVPDSQYRAMLAELTNPTTPSVIDYDVSTMPPGKLKEIYLAENIVFARVFLVGITPDFTVVFGSAALYNPKRGMDISDKVHLDNTIGKLSTFV